MTFKEPVLLLRRENMVTLLNSQKPNQIAYLLCPTRVGQDRRQGRPGLIDMLDPPFNKLIFLKTAALGFCA